VHLVLAAVDSKDALQQELGQVFPGSIREVGPGLFACDRALQAKARFPFLAFARQFMPDAREVKAASIKSWASLLVESVAGVLPDHQTWSLHVVPFKEAVGSSRTGARAWHSRTRKGLPLPSSGVDSRQSVGDHRCRLVREAAMELLQKKRRHLVRYLRNHEGAFTEEEALVQLLLVSPETGFLSVAKAPLPFQEQQVVSCFPGGEVPLAEDKQAPSRAFTKLVAAELRLGRRIAARDTCVSG